MTSICKSDMILFACLPVSQADAPGMLMQEAWWLQGGWFATRFPESTGDDAVEFVICEDGDRKWVKSKDGSNFLVPLNDGEKKSLVQIVFDCGYSV